MQAATYLAIKNEPGGAAGQQQQLALHGQAQQQAAAGYLCPTCVQQAADACPLDLLQLHAALLADIKPRRPRSAADIHAAELTRKVGGGAGVCRRGRVCLGRVLERLCVSGVYVAGPAVVDCKCEQQ
jgi:hypothetical protein